MPPRWRRAAGGDTAPRTNEIADIQGIESNVLRVSGVESLRGGEWTIGPDHVEVASFIGLAAVTGGDVTIDGVKNDDLISILPTFARLGVRVEIGDASATRSGCRQRRSAGSSASSGRESWPGRCRGASSPSSAASRTSRTSSRVPADHRADAGNISPRHGGEAA